MNAKQIRSLIRRLINVVEDQDKQRFEATWSPLAPWVVPIVTLDDPVPSQAVARLVTSFVRGGKLTAEEGYALLEPDWSGSWSYLPVVVGIMAAMNESKRREHSDAMGQLTQAELFENDDDVTLEVINQAAWHELAGELDFNRTVSLLVESGFLTKVEALDLIGPGYEN